MTTAAKLEERSLLGVKDLSAEEIESILDRAQYWEASGKKIHNAVPDAIVANMFFENSTRTRFSFEMAEKRLGAEVLNFSAAVSSVNKGESIYDTVRTLESIGIDAGVIRLKPIGVLPEIAANVKRAADQRRRRQQRASDPGAARSVYDAETFRQIRRACACRSSATSCTAGSLAPICGG